MSKKISKINININKDDPNINDYLTCFSRFGEVPNKAVIYNNYKSKEFFEIIRNMTLKSNISKEIIPLDDGYIINEKYLIDVNDGISLSFVNYDKTSDIGGLIGDVIFFFKSNSSKDVDVLIEEFEKIVFSYQDEDAEERFNILSTGQSGLDIESIDILEADYDNIHLYFNDNIIKKAKKIIKSIKKEKKGLNIIYGDRGCGKTTLSNYIALNINKMVIYIPSNMIDHINNPDFRNFLSRYRNSLIVIDDCDIYFTNYNRLNIFTNNLLQMVDGFASDMYNINFLLIMNTPDIEDIHDDVFDCNNLNNVIRVDKLTQNKCEDLCKHIGRKVKSGEHKLIDVLRKNKIGIDESEIGFN